MVGALVWTALLLGGLFPAGPLSAASTAPAHMTSCAVIPEVISRRGTVPETIRVSFAIDKDTSADLARFTATAPAGALRQFTARGTFAKGTMIADRVLTADSEAPSHTLPAGTECMMTYVHFVDGSSWSAPQ